MGVEHILFCSGARNNKLLNLMANEFLIEFHVDERAASFEALGRAKFKKKPIAICVTSGTAVAQCLPAIIEAYYSELPLIIISADRPARLRHTRAPQTIEQRRIFDGFVETSFSGKLDDFELSSTNYPMHLNIEIDDAELDFIEGSIEKADKDSLKGLKKPIVFISEGHELSAEDLRIIEELEVPRYSECFSNHFFKPSPYNIDNEKELLELFEHRSFDSIFHFGKTPLSKLWRILEKKKKSFPVVNVGKEKFGLSRGMYTNDTHSVLTFLRAFKSKTFRKFCPSKLLTQYENSEPAVIKNILSQRKEGDFIFAGNSMPVRYVELLKREDLIYVASRGVNGIDGQISTAIGLAKSISSNVHAIIGDLTFLYDFGTLTQKLPKNLTVHVIDNNGGRIFERVNVDETLINPHNQKLKQMIKTLPASESIKIYETDNEQTSLFWDKWQ